MAEIVPSQTCVGHSYVQHTESKRLEKHCNWYHSYLMSENHDLREVIAWAYGDGTALQTKNAAVSIQRGLDRQKSTMNGDTVMGDGYYKGQDSERSKWELSAFTFEIEIVPKDG